MWTKSFRDETVKAVDGGYITDEHRNNIISHGGMEKTVDSKEPSRN